MPGLHGKEVDTSSWEAGDWRRARVWNACFLVAWTIFFAILLPQMNWLFFVPLFCLAIIGGIRQVKWLILTSRWLKANEQDD